MKTATKLKGIPIPARNVLKVMDGSQTQMRLIINLDDDVYDHVVRNPDGLYRFSLSTFFDKSVSDPLYCAEWEDVEPQYKVGDVCYIKEALVRHCPNGEIYDACAKYKAGGDVYFPVGHPAEGCIRPWMSDDGTPWKVNVLPARYMPKSAARTFIKILDVRCERIKDISEEDCIAEGVSSEFDSKYSNEMNEALLESVGRYKSRVCAYFNFSQLWNETNGKDAWERNDWVFVYEFELTEKP